jgi:hypothetical protein
MTPHKYAELLRYAADNADARFTSENQVKKYGDWVSKPVTIEVVLENKDFDDWQIYKEPVTEVCYYRHRVKDFIRIEPDLEKWDMKITYIDGKAQKAEFSEDSK